MRAMRMNTVVTAAVLVATVLAGGCANRNLGFILGSPSGLSYGQDLLNDRLAVGLGWSFIDGDGPELTVDWLRHTSERRPGVAAAYWGVGYRYRDRDEADDNGESFESGLRVPFGISYFPSGGDMEAFAEAAPGIDFVDPRFTLDIGIGLRLAF